MLGWRGGESTVRRNVQVLFVVFYACISRDSALSVFFGVVFVDFGAFSSDFPVFLLWRGMHDTVTQTEMSRQYFCRNRL